MTRAIMVILAIALLAGCAAQKELIPTGGSRSDGTVTLSFEYKNWEMPKLDEAQGLATARDRCRAWGYADAQAFGGVSRQCNMPGGYGGGCYQWLATMTYQCLGNGSGQTPRAAKK